MRETKFRAYISPKTIIFFTLKELVDPDRCNMFSFRVLLLPWLRAGNKPDKYTGLKDKNGKEIYEGDIAKRIDGLLGEIVFRDCAFIHQPKDDNGCILHVIHSMEIEVIGNIYENPELLERHD